MSQGALCADLVVEEMTRARGNLENVFEKLAGCTLVWGGNYTFRTFRAGVEANVPNDQATVLKDIFKSLMLCAIVDTLNKMDDAKKAEITAHFAGILNDAGILGHETVREIHIFLFFDGIKRICGLIALDDEFARGVRTAVEARFQTLQRMFALTTPISLHVLPGVVFHPFSLLVEAVELPADRPFIPRNCLEFGDRILTFVSRAQLAPYAGVHSDGMIRFAYRESDTGGACTMSVRDYDYCIGWFIRRVNIFLEIFNITPRVKTVIN